jgi:hypothetical protein
MNDDCLLIRNRSLFRNNSEKQKNNLVYRTKTQQIIQYPMMSSLNRVPYLSRIRVLCVAQSLLLCAVVCRSLVVLLYPLLLHYMSVLPFVASDTPFVVFNIFLINYSHMKKYECNYKMRIKDAPLSEQFQKSI